MRLLFAEYAPLGKRYGACVGDGDFSVIVYRDTLIDSWKAGEEWICFFNIVHANAQRPNV